MKLVPSLIWKKDGLNVEKLSVINLSVKESKICPRCKTENPKVANFCRRCRYKFPEGTKDGTSLSPIIHSFKIQENDYTVGSVIHFEWFVENANIIKLNDWTTWIVEQVESTEENKYAYKLNFLPKMVPGVEITSDD